MTKLPEPSDPTLEAVDAAIVRNNQQEARTYLGCSGLGDPCSRKIWYGWRWILPQIIKATGWRNILDGNAGEPVMAERLKAVPQVRLITEDQNGSQISVSALGGHLKGHLDGVINGLLQAMKTWHVWEHKQVNEKKFRELQKKINDLGEKAALESWNAIYFIQAQLYMGLINSGPIKRHYMTVASAGGRQIQSVRTEFQKEVFDWVIKKAREIIESKTPPIRVSENPKYYLCKWCNFQEHCHGASKTAYVNCRTCAHSTPLLDENAGAPGKTAGSGAWRCEFHGTTLSLKDQRKGCPKHLFIPELIPWAQPIRFDEENNKIHYRTEKGNEFINAEHNAWEKKPRHFASKDLQHINDYHIDNDDLILQTMAKFSPSITKVTKAKEERIPFDDDIPF
jgi:hypothetical protein